MNNTEREALKQAQQALEESNAMLVVLLHEDRRHTELTHDEITQQIFDNRGALNSIDAADAAEAKPDQIEAWMVPMLISFKGSRTSCPEGLQPELEGTVAWRPEAYCDDDPVTDKFGIEHRPYPLFRRDAALPAPMDAQPTLQLRVPEEDGDGVETNLQEDMRLGYEDHANQEQPRLQGESMFLALDYYSDGWKDAIKKYGAQPVSGAVDEMWLPPLPGPSPTHYRERGMLLERMDMFTADQMRERDAMWLKRIAALPVNQAHAAQSESRQERVIDWYTPTEIRERIASNDFNPELMLHHSMHWLDVQPEKNEPEHPNDRAFAALQKIIDYPITDPESMDAANMKLIAIDVMSAQR